MRPIKFRGQNPYTKEWKYGYYFVRTQLGIGYPQIWQEDGTPVPIDPETVGQYTGYLDKHNKKIYEGDIIYHCYFKAYYQIIWGKFSDCCVQGETWVMSPDVWQCTLGYWCQQSDQENAEYGYDEDSGVEVVGNVYENPDLLTEKAATP